MTEAQLFRLADELAEMGDDQVAELLAIVIRDAKHRIGRENVAAIVAVLLIDKAGLVGQPALPHLQR
jgi:hypothetical protein